MCKITKQELLNTCTLSIFVNEAVQITSLPFWTFHWWAVYQVPEEADKFKKAPEQLENDELEKKMPGLDEQALRDEAMRRGLDVKG